MSRNQLESTLAVWLAVVGLVLFFPCASQAEFTLTPTQVVFQWLAWYPKNLPKAATLTTKFMRDGLSKKHWIEKNAPLLKDLQFKYLEGKVLEEGRDEVTATVTVRVRLFVVVGEVRQVERYSLKNIEGHWLH